MALVLDQLACGYTAQAVLTGVNLTLRPSEFVCILGPNGAGKSALLRTVAGLLRPLGGRLLIEGQACSRLSSRERATRLAYVPQAHAPLFAFRTLDVVAMGRAARWPLWAGPSRQDWLAAEKALEAAGVPHLAERVYTELSGGERQLVLLARALAQDARYLILDEPASSLDFGNQVRVLQTLLRLVRSGMSVVMATHHPEHALRCADRVAIVGGGSLSVAGAPAEVLTADRLEALYRVPFVVGLLRDEQGQSLSSCAPKLE